MNHHGAVSRVQAYYSGRCIYSHSHTGTGRISGSDECSSRVRQKTALKWNLFHSGCSGTVCPPLQCASSSCEAQFGWKLHHRCCRLTFVHACSSCGTSDDMDSSLKYCIQDTLLISLRALFFCELLLLSGYLLGIHIGRKQWIQDGFVCDSQGLFCFWSILNTGHNHSSPSVQPETFHKNIWSPKYIFEMTQYLYVFLFLTKDFGGPLPCQTKLLPLNRDSISFNHAFDVNFSYTDQVSNQECLHSCIWNLQLYESTCASQMIPLKLISPFSKRWICWIVLHTLHTLNHHWCPLFFPCVNLECASSNFLPVQKFCNSESLLDNHVFPYGQPRNWKSFMLYKAKEFHLHVLGLLFVCIITTSLPRAFHGNQWHVWTFASEPLDQASSYMCREELVPFLHLQEKTSSKVNWEFISYLAVIFATFFTDKTCSPSPT